MTGRVVAKLRQAIKWQLLRASGHLTSSYYEVSERREFMRKAFTALSFNGISGDYLEFGSWSGNTFTLAYQQSRRVGHQCKLWSFDSFEGLPDQAGAEDEHPHWQKAAMSMSLQQFNDICRHHNIPVSDYQVVPGYYTDTIGNESNLGVFPRDVALAYIDCDMYSSTKVVLNFLANRLKHGMIIAFDDYYCFSKSTLAGERKAFLEFTTSNCRFNFTTYVQFGWHGMSFIVEDRSLLPENDNAHVLTGAECKVSAEERLEPR